MVLHVQWLEQYKINTTRHEQPLTIYLSPKFQVIWLEEVSPVGAPISPLVTPARLHTCEKKFQYSFQLLYSISMSKVLRNCHLTSIVLDCNSIMGSSPNLVMSASLAIHVYWIQSWHLDVTIPSKTPHCYPNVSLFRLLNPHNMYINFCWRYRLLSILPPPRIDRKHVSLLRSTQKADTRGAISRRPG